MTCQNCKFWEAHGQLGACHYFPPAVIEVRDGGAASKWPVTRDTEWCGQFQAKDDVTLNSQLKNSSTKL